MECAIISLAGTEILRLNPDFIDAMWKFDASVFALIYGAPRFLYPKGYAARGAFHDMGKKWPEHVCATYDWTNPDVDWEEAFGTRFMRTFVKFLEEKDFNIRSRVGMSLGAIWAYLSLSLSAYTYNLTDIETSLNANTIPSATWALIEIIKDKDLFKAVRADASAAFDFDSLSQKLSGGGISICPGRHFVKQEIMAAIALIVVNFDIELLEYVHEDG